MNAPVVKPKPFAWSYSKLKNFESCARRHNEIDLLKNFKEDESENLVWGNSLHKAMAKALANGADLPITMRKYQPYVDLAKRLAAAGEMGVELKLAVDRQFNPVTFFDGSAWFRGIADVLFRVGPVAVVWDWKTGKVLEDSVQLGLTATMIFANHPEITSVRSTFVWIGNDATTEEKWTRADMPRLWGELMPRVKRLEQAYLTGEYDPTPSGLCKRYCPVSSCEYYGKGSY